VKLLLDEHYSPEIARQQRRRGHDVVAVSERRDLRGLGDAEIMRRMLGERRVVITANVVDYVPCANALVAAGHGHFGLILTSDRSLPRRKQTIGQFVRILDRLLRSQEADDALRDRVRWLR
jgi:hypothetical protein